MAVGVAMSLENILWCGRGKISVDGEDGGSKGLVNACELLSLKCRWRVERYRLA
jgi:hypothetical protein